MAQTDVAALLKAEKKGKAEAAKELAQYYFDSYQFDEATKHLDTWEKLAKKDKKVSTVGLSELRQKSLLGKNMLERVEKITIIDSIVVDKDKFFEHFKLSPEAGTLEPASWLPKEYNVNAIGPVYVPETSNEVFWTHADSVGAPMQIMHADILDDKSLSEVNVLADNLNEGGDAGYFFMESDGMTFYFANNGENSFGGYDIFMSRRQPDGAVYNPQNMGMPYNSPYDDYMLAIDEYTNVGWWATDRNQIPDKVTIYVFRPNETRVNYDPDDPKLADYAFIKTVDSSDIGFVDNIKNFGEDIEAPEEFRFSLGNGKVYTKFADFRNPKAEAAMHQLILRKNELAQMEQKLEGLRQRYSAGDKSVTQEILSLEKRIPSARQMVKKLSNQVIIEEK